MLAGSQYVPPLLPAIQGFCINIVFALSFGLQNTLLLIEGARGGNVLTIGLICFMFEAVLLTFTASGLVFLNPETVGWLRWAGLLFLLWCALSAARAALAPSFAKTAAMSRTSPVLTALVVSAANPLMWLETVLLTGGIVLQFSGIARASCVCGALLATACRIFGIGYGVRFTNRRLRGAVVSGAANSVIAFVMMSYAAMLFINLMQPPNAEAHTFICPNGSN